MTPQILKDLQENKTLEPYFIWYIKTQLALPKVLQFLIRNQRQKVTEDPSNLKIIYESEQSKTLLFEQLKRYDPSIDVVKTSTLLAHYYIKKLGYKGIKNSTPELLMLDVQHYN